MNATLITSAVAPSELLPIVPTVTTPVPLHVEHHPTQIERLYIQAMFRELCPGILDGSTAENCIPTGIGRRLFVYSRPLSPLQYQNGTTRE
jgi:hypothetical protein